MDSNLLVVSGVRNRLDGEAYINPRRCAVARPAWWFLIVVQK